MQSRFMPVSNIFPFLASRGLMPLPLCGTCSSCVVLLFLCGTCSSCVVLLFLCGTCSSCVVLLFLYLLHPCCAIDLSVTHNTGAKGMCNIHNITMYKGGSTGIKHNTQSYQTLGIQNKTKNTGRCTRGIAKLECNAWEQ